MKVVFIGSTGGQVRWGSNDDPSDLLTIGKVYDVQKVEVHSWHTKYYLKEFPNKKFNSVSFEVIE